MPQLNEYPIEELESLRFVISETKVDMLGVLLSTETRTHLFKWYDRLTQAIADREFTDSQLPFRTPKEIEQTKIEKP